MPLISQDQLKQANLGNLLVYSICRAIPLRPGGDCPSDEILSPLCAVAMVRDMSSTAPLSGASRPSGAEAHFVGVTCGTAEALP